MPFVALDGSRDAADAALSGDVDAVLADHGYGVGKIHQNEGQLVIVGPSAPLDEGPGIGVREGGG